MILVCTANFNPKWWIFSPYVKCIDLYFGYTQRSCGWQYFKNFCIWSEFHIVASFSFHWPLSRPVIAVWQITPALTSFHHAQMMPVRDSGHTVGLTCSVMPGVSAGRLNLVSSHVWCLGSDDVTLELLTRILIWDLCSWLSFLIAWQSQGYWTC